MLKIQSYWESWFETWLNVLSGFLVSWAMWAWVVAPVFGIPVVMGESLLITTIFTVSSLVRSYIWRRLFNRYSERKLAR
jgi:hypothetical protein